MDTALCLDAISGYDGIDDRALGAPKRGTTNFAADLKASAPDGVKGMRIGILKEAFEHAAVDPSMKAFVLSAAWKFRDLGASVEEVSIPYHSKSTTIWTIAERISGCLTLLGLQHGRRGFAMTDIEAAKLPWTQEKFDKAFPTTQNILINGLYLMEKFPALYPKAVNLERRLLDVYEDAFKEYDVLILPSTSFVAPKHGTRTTPIPTIAPTVGLTANTAAFNATGQPAMSIPIGFLPAKEDPAVLLPVGMQIVGGLWKDSKVLRVGHAWEKAYNWKERRQE